MLGNSFGLRTFDKCLRAIKQLQSISISYRIPNLSTNVPELFLNEEANMNAHVSYTFKILRVLSYDSHLLQFQTIVNIPSHIEKRENTLNCSK